MSFPSIPTVWRALLSGTLNALISDDDPETNADRLERLRHLGHWSQDPVLLREARALIGGLRSAREHLLGLLVEVQNGIDAIEDILLPLELGKGLHTLSDDVLSMIFEYVDERATLLRVSRRFHRIASSTPYLWRSIDCKMPTIGHVIESLKQSKATGLELDLCLTISGSTDGFLDVMDVLDNVILHKDRWTTLATTPLWADDVRPLVQICERLSKLHLPRLTSLAISYAPDYDPVTTKILRNTESFFHYYRSLEAPNLRKLHIVNFIPGSIPGAPMLSSVKIEFHNIELENGTFRYLAIFLSSIPTLEAFDLSIKCLNIDEQSDVPITVLPNLRTLRIDVRANIAPLLTPFRKAILTPTVRKIHWIVRGGFQKVEYPTENKWLERMLCHVEYPTLQELYFKFDWYDERFKEPAYSIPFQKLPGLRTLTLDTPSFRPYIGYNLKIPALRSLCLRSCDPHWMDWLEEMRNCLREQGDLEGLRQVTVNRLNGSMKKWVKETFGGRKIKWVNGVDDSEDKEIA